MKKHIYIGLLIVVLIATNITLLCFNIILKNNMNDGVGSICFDESLSDVISVHEHEFFTKKILYPTVEGTKYDDKINALITEYPYMLIDKVTNEKYIEHEYLNGAKNKVNLTYNLETLFNSILKISYHELGNDRTAFWESRTIIHINLGNGEAIKLTDVFTIDNRLINFKSKDYIPPGETNRNYSFQDAFPICDSVGQFLSYIDSGDYGWNLEDKYFSLFNSDSHHGSYIQIPYSEISDLINPQYKEMLLG